MLQLDACNKGIDDFIVLTGEFLPDSLLLVVAIAKAIAYFARLESCQNSHRRIRVICALHRDLPKRQTIKTHSFFSSVTPSHSCARAGILTGFPLATVLTIALGSPNPRLIAIAAETLDFRGTRFSRVLWLLVPTFSLPNAPAALTGPPSMQIGMLSYHSVQ